MTDVIDSHRSRRRGWWRATLPWLLLVLVCVAVWGFASHRAEITGLPATSNSRSPVIPRDNPLEDDDWVLGDVQLNPSWGALTARILNHTTETRSTYFTVTVLSGGHLVGSFSGAVNNIEPGATATATLIGPKIPADTTNYTYEIQAG